MKHFQLITIPAFVFFGFVITPAFGQDAMEDMNSRQIMRYGLQAMKSGDIFTAIDYLAAYLEEEPDDANMSYTLAELYFKERNYPAAEKYYHKAFRAKRRKFPEAQFKYAVCLKMQGKYEEALKEFNIFRRYSRDVSKSKSVYYKNRLQSEIEGCELALADSIHTNYVVNNMHGINHKHIDFNPIPLEEDLMIYASLPMDEMQYFDPATDSIPKRRFYMAYKDGKSWKTGEEFGGDLINTQEANTGNGAFSPDHKRFYFTRCSKHQGIANKMICQIYRTEKKNNEWQEPELLNNEINMPGYTSSMPAVGVSRRNTDMLYFVSDRPEGGQGGMDIWYTYWDPRREAFMPPRNCGRKINTAGDEMTPFYHVNSKTMYFSSDAYPNYGGLDVFKTRGSGRQFSEPENIGKPVNSEVDELYFSKAEEGYYGYFVSNRAGGQSLRHETCCDDIYQYIDSDYIRIWLTGQIYGITDLSFYNSIREEYEQNLTIDHLDHMDDTSSMERLHKYPVSLFMKDPDTGKESFIKTDSTNQGRFWFNLEQGIDYVLKVKDFNRDEKEFALTTRDITKDDTLHMDAIIVNTIPTEPLILKNVYYEYNDHKLTDEAKNVIDNTIFDLLQENPSIVVEISSHTDSVGSDEFNLELSQKRAESVVEHLIDRGIPEDQLEAKGYGEKDPIAPNTNPDGTDNEEGRAKNRRTEFRIIGELEDYSDIIYEE